MLLPLLLAIASVPTKPAHSATAPAATPAPRQSLMDAVAQRMTPKSRPVFLRYVSQTLTPQAQADHDAEVRYLQSLHALVAAPKLDVDGAYRMIDQRKQAEAAFTASIRSSAFAMIRSLPEADRKLALTAIFADARLPATQAAPATR